MSSQNLENVIINFHHLVQTGFSASLSKRKSAGTRRYLESIPDLRESDISLVLDFQYGCRICSVEAATL